MKNDYKMMMDKLENFLINKWCFSIPRYQRKYIWSKENIKQLIEDINLYNEANSRFFIGNIVILENGDNEYEIIDGQQRITTLQLIVLSMIYLYKKANSQELNDKIDYLKDFVYVLLSNGKKINKVMIDDKSYGVLLNYCISKDKNYLKIDEYLEKEESIFLEKFKNIVEIFEELKISSEEEIDVFRDKLINININVITTYNEQDAFTIFETLNARGVQLTQTELLKNFIFKYVSEGDTIDITNLEWNDMYDELEEEADNFTFHFFRMFYGYKGKLEDLYNYVKSECYSKSNTKLEVKNIFDKMKKFSIYYKRLLHINQNDNYECKTYSYMKAKNNKQLRSLLMVLYYKKQEGLLDEYNYNDIMKMIFKFFVGFNILKNTSNSINSLVIVASNKIYNANNSFSVIKCFYEFYQELEKYYPTKEDFISSISLLKFSNKNKKGNVNSKTLVFLLNEIMDADYYNYSEYNIEHINSDDVCIESRWKLGNLIAIPVEFHKKIKTDVVSEKMKLYAMSGIKHIINFTLEYPKYDENSIDIRTDNLNKKIIDEFFVDSDKIENELSAIKLLESYFKINNDNIKLYNIKEIKYMLELVKKDDTFIELNEFVNSLNKSEKKENNK